MAEQPDPPPPANDSIQRTLDLVGDRWTLLVLREVFRGLRRFEALRAELGIARNMLTDRLHKLVEAGIIVAVPYQAHPVRYDYRLTAKGLDLSPILVALMRWGDEWGVTGPPATVLIHDTCGEPLEQVLRCPTCDEKVTARHIRSRPGPGRPTTHERPTTRTTRASS